MSTLFRSLIAGAVVVLVGTTAWVLLQDEAEHEVRVELPAASAEPASVLAAPIGMSDRRDSTTQGEHADTATSSHSRRSVATGPVLAGRVVDAGGAPLANAQVQLFQRPRLTALARQGSLRDWVGPNSKRLRVGRVTHRTVTDDGGGYHLPAFALRAGPVAIGVARTGFAPALSHWESGDELPTVTLERGSTVLGRVEDGAGTPVAGAEVRIELAGRDRTLEQLVPVARTDGTGRFALADLPAGRAYLVVTASGYLASKSSSVEVVAGARVDAGTLKLERGAELSGTVRDSRGQAIADAAIEVTAARTEAHPGSDPRVSETTTDTRGEFRLAVRARVALRLTARHPLHADEVVDLAKPTTALSITMSPRISVTGVVLDQRTGSPIESFGIRARAISEQHGTDAGIPRRAPGPTRHERGEFTIHGLQPGTYMLDIDADGHARTAAGPIVVDRGRTPASVTIRLEPGITIRGTVVDRRTGVPVSGARVELCERSPLDHRLPDFRRLFAGDGSGPPPSLPLDEARTDHDGKFALELERPGRVRVVVCDVDHARFVEELSVTENHSMRITLSAGARLFGVVGGANRENARVRVRDTHGRVRTARIARDGSYELKRLAPGAYFVSVVAKAVDPASWLSDLDRKPDLVIDKDGDIRHDIDAAARKPATVIGKLSHNGRPGTDLELVLEPMHVNLGGDDALAQLARRVSGPTSATPDETGSFLLSSPASGRYTLQVRRREGRAVLHEEEVVLTRGKPLRRDVDIQTGNLALAVRDGSGRVERARIQLVRADVAGNRAPSDWITLSTWRSAEVVGGEVRVAELTRGEWRYAIDGPTIAPRTGRVSIPGNASTRHAEVRVTARARPPAERHR